MYLETSLAVKNLTRAAAFAVASIVLAACGGSSSPSVINVPSTSGYVADSAVTGASCNVFAITDGVASTVTLGTGTSAAGAVDFGVVDFTGPAQIQCTGGTFTDEATGQTLNAPSMSAVVNFIPGGTYVVSLLSEIASRLALAQGDLTTALSTYNTAVADSFGLDGIDITTQIPTDLNTSTAEDNAAGHFGTALAVLSQAVHDGSMGTTREEMLAAAIADMEDGAMSPESVLLLEAAMANFMAGNAAAKAHANADVAIQVLNSSGTGTRPVASAGNDQSAVVAGTTVTLTGSGTDADGEITAYQWTQTSGTNVTLSSASSASTSFTAPSAGKLEFKLTVTDSAGNQHSDSVVILVETAINAGANVTKTYGNAPFTQAATGGSGTGAFSYTSSNSAVATVNNAGKVTITGAGTTTITATKAADSDFAASSDSYVLTVNKASQSPLDAGPDLTKTFGDAPFTQAATGGSGTGAVGYTSSATSVATVTSTGVVTIVGAGSATITVTRAADGNYAAASDSYAVTVNKANQAPLNAGANVAKTYGDAAFTRAATGGSGNGVVAYASSATSVATVDNTGKVTIVGAGSATITATKAADGNYNPATDSYTLTVGKANQTVLNAGVDVTKNLSDDSFTRAATGGSGTGAISYTSSDTSVATVASGGVVTLKAGGSTTITATRAGGSNYNDVSDSYDLTVIAISISGIAPTAGPTISQDGTVTLPANASSVLGSALSGKTLTITGTGFGKTKNTVKFKSDTTGGSNVDVSGTTITAWTDTTIVLPAPSVTLVSAGTQENYTVTVTTSGGATATSAFKYDDCDTCRLNDGCPF